MKQQGKKYLELKKLVDKPFYSLSEAVALLKKTSPSKFDASCEIHINLGVDVKQSDQMVRSTIIMPNGIGKEVRVVAFVTEDKVKEALAAGAIKAGNEELIDEVVKGFLDFDVAVATPDMMKNLGKIAKNLGQRGLMPNPKAGTVTPNFVQAIAEIKKGKVEFRTDKFGILHNSFGKVSFGEKELLENLKTFVKAVLDVRPAAIKGTYVKSMAVSSTMGPGIKIDVSSALTEAKEA